MDLETKYAQLGGADGATSLYLFREISEAAQEGNEDDSSEFHNASKKQVEAAATAF